MIGAAGGDRTHGPRLRRPSQASCGNGDCLSTNVLKRYKTKACIDNFATTESRFKLIKVVLFRFLAEILKRSIFPFLTIALSFGHKVNAGLTFEAVMGSLSPIISPGLSQLLISIAGWMT